MMDNDQAEIFEYMQGQLNSRNISSGAFSYGHKELSDRVHAMMGKPLRRRVFAPGDHSIDDVSRRVPIAGDPWFLWAFNNILPEVSPDDLEKDSEHPAIIALDPILRRYPGLKPLLCLQSPDELTIIRDFWNSRQIYWNMAKFHIKEMRFESWSLGSSMYFYSEGPAWQHSEGLEHLEENAMSEHYAGYLAFPVGMGGVQETWSLISETMNEDSHKCEWISPEDITAAELRYEKEILEGKNLFPPDMRELNAVIGKPMLTHSYVPERDVEIPARVFQGLDSIDPLIWARYYLPREGKFPMPGELVCMVCKTMPFIIWWFQESSPFMYAGNWFETEFYSSGIVLEVVHDEDEIYPVYKVLCKGEEIYLKPTDFLEYEVGKRVAVLKAVKWEGSFNWMQMKRHNVIPEDLDHKKILDLEASGKTPHELAVPDWFIAPITFYAEE